MVNIKVLSMMMMSRMMMSRLQCEVMMSMMMMSRLQCEVSKLTNDGAFNLEPNVGRLQCRQMIIHQDAVGNKNDLYDDHT